MDHRHRADHQPDADDEGQLEVLARHLGEELQLALRVRGLPAHVGEPVHEVLLVGAELDVLDRPERLTGLLEHVGVVPLQSNADPPAARRDRPIDDGVRGGEVAQQRDCGERLGHREQAAPWRRRR